MNQIDQIKELQWQGYGPTEIAARLNIDRKTTAKYMLKADFSPTVGTRAVFIKIDDASDITVRQIS